MNPASFAGRNAMSAAGKNRWTSYLFVKNALEEDYEAMLTQAVYGEQPEVEFHGIKYQQETGSPIHPELMKLPGLKEFLKVFAEFQIKIETMARENLIGRGRKEKYVFTNFIKF